jgi:hypothetical protein
MLSMSNYLQNLTYGEIYPAYDRILGVAAAKGLVQLCAVDVCRLRDACMRVSIARVYRVNVRSRTRCATAATAFGAKFSLRVLAQTERGLSYTACCAYGEKCVVCDLRTFVLCDARLTAVRATLIRARWRTPQPVVKTRFQLLSPLL